MDPMATTFAVILVLALVGLLLLLRHDRRIDAMKSKKEGQSRKKKKKVSKRKV